MPHIVWKIGTFLELDLDQFYEILKLRIDVFVVEQQCAYPELDVYDRQKETRHLAGYDECGDLIAYARLLPAGFTFPESSIGRCVVKKDVRGAGLGHELLRAALREIQRCWPNDSIKIAAQEYLEGFYAQYQFVRVSERYLDVGVPHVDMLRKSID